MRYSTNQIRTGSRGILTMLLAGLLWLSATAAQAQQPTLPASPTLCDYANEPATISLTAQNVPSGYSTVYVLVNMTSGLIVQTNATAPTFTGVMRGQYYAVAAHYKGVLTNATAGKLISDVVSSDQCLTYGPALALKVCPASLACDYAIAPASVTFTAQSLPNGVTTTYALVNLTTNLIAQVSQTASFTGVVKGEYGITAVHYTGSLTALVGGNRLYDVTTQNANCLSVSNTLYFTVCNSPIAITGPLTGTTVASLNPPISGTTTPGASVTVTGSPGSTGGPCITTANASGVWSCSSITFPAGPAGVTATDGSTSAVSNFTVAPPVPPAIAVTGPATSTATTTPLVSGTATPGSIVTLTGPTGATLCSTTATAAGSWSCTVNISPGSTTITATACTSVGCSTATTSFTAIAPPTIAILTPADGGIATTTPTVSGTATPLASVTVLAPGGQSCVTTASASGTYACASLTFTSGPASVTAVVSNPGGTTSVVNTFTAVAPASLTLAPTGPSTTTAVVISGTATPGSPVVITGPGPVTLCSTTASASGTFACSVTVPSGPTTLTVTACTSAGCSTATTSFTAVAPPSLTVTGPVGVSTTTSPTISGTATPNSVITITNPAGQTVCQTTADVNGVFLCGPISGLPTGPNTLTATATTPGGSTSQPISFTTVTVPTVAILTPTTNGTATTTPVISGTATPNAVVTINGGPGSTGGPVSVTASPTGVYSTTAITFPTGLASVTAVATNPGGTSTPAISSFTVVAPPSLTVSGPVNVSTTATPTVSGTATPNSVITITNPAGQTVCQTTADVNGVFLCGPISGLPTGPNNLTVTATTPGGSTSQPISFTTVMVPTVAILTPTNNGTATTTPVISGTATPNAVVTISGGPGSTGGPVSVTAGPTGAYSTSALTFPAGLASVTAIATNAGGSSTPAVSSFTAIAPCTTPTVAGTAVYTGTTPICSTANSGAVTLTGQTGSVLRWETSTDNGGTWLPIVNTTTSLTFSNVANNQQYRAVVKNGASCATANAAPVVLTTNATACNAVLNCDYPAMTIQKQ